MTPAALDALRRIASGSGASPNESAMAQKLLARLGYAAPPAPESRGADWAPSRAPTPRAPARTRPPFVIHGEDERMRAMGTLAGHHAAAGGLPYDHAVAIGIDVLDAVSAIVGYSPTAMPAEWVYLAPSGAAESIVAIGGGWVTMAGPIARLRALRPDATHECPICRAQFTSDAVQRLAALPGWGVWPFAWFGRPAQGTLCPGCQGCAIRARPHLTPRPAASGLEKHHA